MRHVSTTLFTLFALAGCGGGTDSGAPPASTPPIVDPASTSAIIGDAITNETALLALSVADRAVVRYRMYNGYVSALQGQMLLRVLDSGAIYVDENGVSSCRYTDRETGEFYFGGRVRVTQNAADAPKFEFTQCLIQPLGVISGGTAVADQVIRSADLKTTSFSLRTDARFVDDDDAGDVTGSTTYSYRYSDASDPAKDIRWGYTRTHTGQLVYLRNGRTDQYQDALITFGYSGITGSGVDTIDIGRLEITSPRFTASKLLVTTPAPLTSYLGYRPGELSGTLRVVSASDGSRAEAAFITASTFRIRVWDRHSALTLDTTKTDADADVQAAEKQALD